MEKDWTSIEEYIIRGRVISNKENGGLENVKLDISFHVEFEEIKYETTTNTLGQFELKVKTNIKDNNGVSTISRLSPLYFQKSGYTNKNILPYTSHNVIKTDVGIIKLESHQSNLKKEITKQKNISGDTIKKIKDLKPKDPQTALRKAVSNVIKRLKSTLLPVVVALLMEFGIGKLEEAIINNSQGTCPVPKRLPSLIKKRNNIVKSLNSIYKMLDATIISLTVINTLAQLFVVVKELLLKLPIPIAIGTPPGPQGGLIFSQTTGNILTSEDNVKKLEKSIEKFQHLSISILISLIMLRTTLTTMLNLLKLLDKNIGACVDEIDLEEIDPELLVLLEDARKSDTSQPQTRIVNGFILGVKNEDKQIGTLTRRYAFAKNKQDVILLKGELSFSADSQILMDELEFYIKENDLKAF